MTARGRVVQRASQTVMIIALISQPCCVRSTYIFSPEEPGDEHQLATIDTPDGRVYAGEFSPLSLRRVCPRGLQSITTQFGIFALASIGLAGTGYSVRDMSFRCVGSVKAKDKTAR